MNELFLNEKWRLGVPDSPEARFANEHLADVVPELLTAHQDAVARLSVGQSLRMRTSSIEGAFHAVIGGESAPGVGGASGYFPLLILRSEEVGFAAFDRPVQPEDLLVPPLTIFRRLSATLPRTLTDHLDVYWSACPRSGCRSSTCRGRWRFNTKQVSVVRGIATANSIPSGSTNTERQSTPKRCLASTGPAARSFSPTGLCECFRSPMR